MKRISLISALVISSTCLAGGILPCQVYRRGLTNEQIDGILARHPDAQLRITAQDWRGMRYQLTRFHNMTNYVEQIGGSNDCSKVLLKLHDVGEELSKSNSALRVSLDMADRAVDEWRETAAQWQAEAETNAASAEVWMEAATNNAARVERVTAALDERRAEYVEKRDKAALPTTKAIYQAFIDAIDRIKERLDIEGGGD